MIGTGVVLLGGKRCAQRRQSFCVPAERLQRDAAQQGSSRGKARRHAALRAGAALDASEQRQRVFGLSLVQQHFGADEQRHPVLLPRLGDLGPRLAHAARPLAEVRRRTRQAAERLDPACRHQCLGLLDGRCVAAGTSFERRQESRGVGARPTDSSTTACRTRT